MTPQTKIAAFKGIAVAVERFGDIAAAATALGINAERLDGVSRDKLPIPPQWVDGLIAFGEGRVSCDGFKMMRERYYHINGISRHAGVLPSGKAGKSVVAPPLSKYKLIRIVGQRLRLMPPHQDLPHGAVFVNTLCNRPVYIDGKLRDIHLSIEVLEPHLNDGKLTKKATKAAKV